MPASSNNLLPGLSEAPHYHGHRERLRERFAALEIRDQTRLPRDLWEKRGEDSLRGAFLRRLYERLEQAATREEEETVVMAARFGLAALEHRDLG